MWALQHERESESQFGVEMFVGHGSLRESMEQVASLIGFVCYVRIAYSQTTGRRKEIAREVTLPVYLSFLVKFYNFTEQKVYLSNPL